MSKLVFQIASNLLILWAMGLITFTTIAVFTGDWTLINGALATIYASSTGILATVTGYVQKRLSDLRDEEHTRSSE